jgi:hypothetical protein
LDQPSSAFPASERHTQNFHRGSAPYILVKPFFTAAVAAVKLLRCILCLGLKDLLAVVVEQMHKMFVCIVIRFEEITRVQDAYWKMRSKDAHHTINP